jgi:2-polyprenyl-6-methoxyphenol hydroxylase-like FAD-dependent oxidoreductase
MIENNDDNDETRDDENNNEIAIENNCQLNQSYTMPFDILIGADGAHSKVAKLSKIESKQRNMLRVGPQFIKVILVVVIEMHVLLIFIDCIHIHM